MAKQKSAKKTKRAVKRATAKRRRARATKATATDWPGFDTGSYPGDAAIITWAAKSPYRFVGFYLDAPCHTTTTFKTWKGKDPHLKAAGLGLAIIYVGFQQGGCGQAKLSRAKGIEHGQDTVTKFTAEGFPNGAVVFLDVEHYNGTLSAPMEDYIRGWIGVILDSGKVTAGIYCPTSKANKIRAAAKREYAARALPGGSPVLDGQGRSALRSGDLDARRKWSVVRLGVAGPPRHQRDARQRHHKSIRTWPTAAVRQTRD